jgi:hypothetical protein
MAAEWSKNDSKAATSWVESLPNGEKKSAALSAWSESRVQNDPNGMATDALGMPAGEIRTRYLTTACRQLAIRDLPGTVELLKQLSDAALRQTILEQAAGSCDLMHMDQATKYVVAMPPGEDQKALIKGLLTRWAPADPQSALNWLCSFPETNSQPEQVHAVIKAWSQREPAAVAKWLANVPAGTASEGMFSAFLEGAAVKYPEFAGQWTQSVADETNRRKFQAQVARQWMKTDSSAATKWIDGLDLPEDLKQPLKAPSP